MLKLLFLTLVCIAAAQGIAATDFVDGHWEVTVGMLFGWIVGVFAALRVESDE